MNRSRQLWNPRCRKGPLSMEGGPCSFPGAEPFAVEPGGCGWADVQALARFWTDLTRRPKALSFLRLSKADMAAWSDSFLSFM